MPSQLLKSPSAGKPGRIDRARLDAAMFPSVMELPIRFDDLDVLWHVNNVSIIALLQEARVHFNREMAIPPLGEGLRTVVAASNVEYAGELTYPGMVQIRSGIGGIGRTSFTFMQVIGQNDQNAVYSQVAMVVTNAQGPFPLPENFRQAIGKCSLRDR